MYSCTSNVMCTFVFALQDALPPPPPPPPQSSVVGAASSLAAGQRPSPSISDQSGRQRPTVWVIKTVPHTNMRSSSMCSETEIRSNSHTSSMHSLTAEGNSSPLSDPPPVIRVRLQSVNLCTGEEVNTCGRHSPGPHWRPSVSPLTSDPSPLPSLLLLDTPHTW